MRFKILNYSYHRFQNGVFNLYQFLRNNLINYSTTAVCNFNDISKTHYAWIEIIRQNTIISQNHLTPEIKLHLITPECNLWSANENSSPFHDPFWAFYWPGGQVLSRYIIDNPTVVKNKIVLDFGCGSGVCIIAAALSHAKTVIANDIDKVAGVASQLNAEINKMPVKFDSTNLIGQYQPWDCILVGDMFYDEGLATHVMKWLPQLHTKQF